MSLPACGYVVKKLVSLSRLLIEKGLNTLTSGNLSALCQINDVQFVALTPSGLNKYELSYDDIVLYHRSSHSFYGTRKPTSEYKMHLSVYEKNNEIKAIAHAHNPVTLSLVDAFQDFETKQKVVDSVFNKTNLVESKYVLGSTCVVDYIKPGSYELAEKVSVLSMKCDNVILSRHGAVSFGNNIDKAVERILALEYTSLYYYNISIIRKHNKY